MSLLTVTAKGQVTLQRELLNHLGVQPRQRLSIEKLPNGRLELRGAVAPGRIADVFGILKNRSKSSMSLQEIDQSIASSWEDEP